MSDGTLCYICPSDKFVDDHHYDCLHGLLSPETVPLCRRCHVTYHNLGVGSFSPDTTEKALEVENRRREILRSLPSNHIHYENLPPMKLEDIKHSRYWYKKWGIAPPIREKEKALVRRTPFRMPNCPALCGDDWLRNHLNDYTPAEIEALAIEIACDNRWLPPVLVASKKGAVKALVRSLGDA